VKTSCFAVLACLVAGLPLAACDESPRFDTSSLAAYRESLAAIKAKLSSRDQERLDAALLTAATDDPAGIYLPLENPRAVVRSSLEGVADPLIYLDRLRTKIDGRTAAKVIALTAANLDDLIARADQQAVGADKILAAISIDNARYGWDRSEKYDNGPFAAFSAANLSPYTVWGIKLSGVLTAHGRVIAAGGGLSYSFPTPLQPGMQQSGTIHLDTRSAWANPDLENADADFALKVVNILTLRGSLLYLDADIVEAMKRKRDILRGG
jgi:hypothetical protein